MLYETSVECPGCGRTVTFRATPNVDLRWSQSSIILTSIGTVASEAGGWFHGMLVAIAPGPWEYEFDRATVRFEGSWPADGFEIIHECSGGGLAGNREPRRPRPPRALLLIERDLETG